MLLFFDFDSAIVWKFVAIGTIEAVAVEAAGIVDPLLLCPELFAVAVVLAADNSWAKFPAKCKPFTLEVVGDDAVDTNSGVTLVASEK